MVGHVERMRAMRKAQSENVQKKLSNCEVMMWKELQY
jgi:hypothetical protein